jgi:hypothetical protein
MTYKPKDREVTTLVKGGKLIKTYWYYDDASEEGEYRVKEVTDQAIRLLFEEVELDDDVTLKDVFLLLNTELDLFDAVIGNWCKEFTQEALSAPGKPYDNTKYDPEMIEYLELRKSITIDKCLGKTNTYGTSRPDFGGVGVVLQKDDDVEHYKKGDRITWGITFTPTNELINIPLKLNKDMPIYYMDYDSKDLKEWDKTIYTCPDVTYTLGDILNGVVWELSFHGGPDSRDDFKDKLDKQVETIKKEYEEEN